MYLWKHFTLHLGLHNHSLYKWTKGILSIVHVHKVDLQYKNVFPSEIARRPELHCWAAEGDPVHREEPADNVWRGDAPPAPDPGICGSSGRHSPTPPSVQGHVWETGSASIDPQRFKVINQFCFTCCHFLCYLLYICFFKKITYMWSNSAFFI